MAGRAQDSLTALAELAADVPASIEAAQAIFEEEPSPQEEAKAQDPRAEVECSFHFRHEDARGRVFEGDFTNRFQDRAGQRRIADLEIRLNSGRPTGTTPPHQGVMNHMLAWLHISLVKRPSWAKDLEAIHSDRIIERLFSEVWAHQSYFCGDWDGNSEGASEV